MSGNCSSSSVRTGEKALACEGKEVIGASFKGGMSSSKCTFAQFNVRFMSDSEQCLRDQL